MYDLWVKIDLIALVLNLISLIVLLTVDVKTYGQYVWEPLNWKDLINYLLVLMLFAYVVRLFFYLLVQPSIGRLLIMIYEIKETLFSMLLIQLFFILISATIFTTLYQDYTQFYVGFWTSIETLMMAMIMNPI